jgi:hypothetical protein
LSTDLSLYAKIAHEYKPSIEDLNKKRQGILAELQRELGAPVMSYMANTMHPFSAIQLPDVDIIVNFAQHLSKEGKKLYLLLESLGGDGSVAEKLVMIFREAFPERFSVIVPNVAKSAATMLALGADELIMGPSSELGPIDPQLVMATGNPQQPALIISARSIINFFERMKREISANADLVNAYYPLARQLRPDLIEMAEDAVEFSKSYAKKWLKQGLMKGRNDEDINKTVDYLSGAKLYKLHNSVINHTDASDILKLNVTYWELNDPKWKKVLEYYFSVRVFFQINPNIIKLFETSSESVMQQVQVVQAPQQPPPQQPSQPQQPREANPPPSSKIPMQSLGDSRSPTFAAPSTRSLNSCRRPEDDL